MLVASDRVDGVETRFVAPHPTVHRTALTAESDSTPVPIVMRLELGFREIPCSASAILFESWSRLLNFVTQPSAWHTVGLQEGFPKRLKE